MVRKRKKKGKRKSKPKLTAITDVVAKAVTSRKLMQLWNEALLSDEVKDLRQRLDKAETDREAMRKRAAEREDQQEAVFDTLKERVVIAQSEIQVALGVPQIRRCVTYSSCLRKSLDHKAFFWVL